jgi:cytochrome b
MSTQNKQSGLVWDMPVRVFHWSLALSFAGAWLTGESEYWKLWHLAFGYSMAMLIVFRLLWGVVGTRYARFTQFVRGPGAVKAYFLSYLRGRPQRHVGHNPAGALAILAIIAIIGVVAASGYASYEEIGGEWLQDIHEAAANLLLGIVVIHIAAVILTSVVHKENLIRAMLTGKKMLAPGEAIPYAGAAIACGLLCALTGLWWFIVR